MRAWIPLAMALLALAAPVRAAEDWPSRPLRVVVPNPPGGPTDIIARLVGPGLTERLGQPVVIDNRAGADGVMGSDVVAKAPPDGYTLLLTSSSHAIHPAVYATMPFDTEAAFAPVALLVRMPFLMVIHPSVPAQSVADFIAYARQHPGKLNYGSAGNGGGVHLSTELLKRLAGIDLVHIPYKGGNPLLTDLVAGQVQLAIAPISAALPLAREGRLRALAVTSAQRVASVPDIPSLAETYPGFDTATWYGVLAPAGTAPASIARLNAALDAIIRLPNSIARVTELGGDVAVGPPDAFGAVIHDEIAKWAAVARDAHVRID